MARPIGSGTFRIADREESRRAWEQCNHALLLRGEISWDELSDEELEYGAGFNPGGHHSNVKQVFGPLPPRIERDLMRARTRRALAHVQAAALASVNVVTEIMEDAEQPGGVRLKAAAMVQDRAWGQAPQVVAVTDDADKFEALLAAVADRGDPELERIDRSLTFGSPDVIPGEVA